MEFLLVSPPQSDSAKRHIIVARSPYTPSAILVEFETRIQILVHELKIKWMCSFLTNSHLQDNDTMGAKESGRGSQELPQADPEHLDRAKAVKRRAGPVGPARPAHTGLTAAARELEGPKVTGKREEKNDCGFKSRNLGFASLCCSFPMLETWKSYFPSLDLYFLLCKTERMNQFIFSEIFRSIILDLFNHHQSVYG